MDISFGAHQVAWSGTYKEGDEDGGVHENETEDGGPAVAEPGGDWTSQEDTDKGAALAGLEESGLPLRLDGVLDRHNARVGDDDAIPLLEVIEGDEVAIEGSESANRLKGDGFISLALTH